MKDLNDDKLTRDILRNSYLDLDDPEFGAATMKRIARATRRRRIFNEILLNLLVFVATDALIYLFLRATGMSVFDLAGRSAAFLDRIFARAGELKAAGGNLATYLVVTFAGIMAIISILELSFNYWKNKKRGNGSVSG